MRSNVWLASLVLIIVYTFPACASGFDDKVFDQHTIDALALKASQAPPREQCFLYAQLVHQMTEVSLRQYSAGESEKASGMLKQIQALVHKMHISMTENDKRLKDSEILLRHAAFRLGEMLHNSNYEDRTLVAETLAQVDQAQNETMMQVFRK
ncbi:MAG: hypothetical protein ABSG51_04870 [Terracidiphilus sp.]